MQYYVWLISFLLGYLVLGTAYAERPDFPDMHRYHDQLHISREENWLQRQIREFRTYPHLDRAYRLLDSNRVPEARAELEAFLALDPRDPSARLTYVMLLHRLQEHRELIHQADILISAHQGFVPALLYRGLAHQALGAIDLATADFETAANSAHVQEPDRLFALNMVVDLAIQQQHYREALAARSAEISRGTCAKALC